MRSGIRKIQGSSKRTFFNPFDHEARKVQRVEMMTRSQSERVKGDEYQAWCDDDTDKARETLQISCTLTDGTGLSHNPAYER